MNNSWYFVLGFLAEGLFSARVIIQWILSEKAKKVVSPTIYWQLSLLASILLSVYGWLRGDFAIILGQFITYYIYIWNLKSKNNWRKFYPIARYIILLLPIVALTYGFIWGKNTFDRLFENETIPRWLLLLGMFGQVVFTFRFVYQWWYSRRKNESVLPTGFWIISIMGSALIMTYGLLRKDPVIIVGQFAIITYIRNLWLDIKARKTNELEL